MYKGIGPERGITVPEEEAYEYALDRCLNGGDLNEFKEMLVEWYFSGNWVKEDDDERTEIPTAAGIRD